MINHMRKKLLLLGWTFGFCLVTLCSWAQDSGVSADINADKQAILIGEPLRLTLTIRSSSPHPTFPLFPDSVAHFEVLTRSKLDTVIQGNNWQLQQVVILTSFDSGHWVIPSLDLPGTNIVTDSVGVDVGYIPMKAGDQIKDIKDIISVNLHVPWWLLIVASIVLVGLIILLIRMLRTKKLLGKQASEPPYEEAIKTLEDLPIPMATADIKPYYTSLENILKRYLSREYQWKTQQYTTSELLMRLQEDMQDSTAFSALAEALRLGDAVKFAKFFPDNNWHTQSKDRVRKAIDYLHQTPKTS
jgi:hypothetical protein